jgi:uncharacterized membrane protein YkvI
VDGPGGRRLQGVEPRLDLEPVSAPSRFERWFLPGFAFKAVVIGGGYATGRELAEFFLPSGPLGGVLGMVLAMLAFSLISTVTFLFARAVAAYDYGAFFRSLLGPAAPLFDLAFVALLVIVLSVFGAAAGEIGRALFGWPTLAGTLALVAGIALVVTFGNRSVESLFKWVTYFLYLVYAVFVVLVVSHAADRIGTAFGATAPTGAWAMGGLTYAGYNAFAAVAILPVLRHLTGPRDAVIAGLLCGPLGMLPALLFFVCMTAWYPEIAAATLPSDFVLTRIDAPAFHVVFQLMIFAALLESGTGSVHALNQRIAGVLAPRSVTLTPAARLSIAAGTLVLAVFVANRVGLVALIASGYRFLAWLFIGVYVIPVMTLGLWRVLAGRAAATVPEGVSG